MTGSERIERTTGQVDHADIYIASPEGVIDTAALFRFARFASPYIVSMIILTAIGAAAYLYTARPMYTASARLLFDPKSSPSFDQSTRWLEPSAEMTTRIESQVEIIRSGVTARRVIFELKLFDDPEFVPKSGLSSIAAIAAPQSSSRIQSAALKQALEGQRIRARMEGTLPIFLKNLYVRRVGLSSAIEIAYKASSPERASKIANALAAAYIKMSIERKAQEAKRGVIWLHERLAELRQQAFDAKRDVERFKITGAGSASDSTVRKAELQSVADTYLKMYESFLLKSMETQQRVSYPVSDAHVVSAASPSFVSKSPKRGAVIGFAVAFGVLSGLGLAFARLSLDRRIRRLDAASRAGLRTLGVVDFDDKLVSPSKAGGRRPKSRSGQDLGLVFSSPTLLQLRSVNTALTTPELSDRRRIGVAGITKGCGATTVAAKLALISAAGGAKTLLVDANRLWPRLSNGLAAPDSEIGFFDCMKDEIGAETAIHECGGEGFAFLPVGTFDADSKHRVDASFGLSVTRDAERVRRITMGYDLCIFDLPPFQTESELRSIAPALDAVILVAEFGATTIDELMRAKAELARSGVYVIGVVLNKVSDARRLV